MCLIDAILTPIPQLLVFQFHLNLKNFKIQKNIITVYPKNTFEISYFDVIFNYCKSISTLSVMYYSDENILVREFIKNMPNCKVLYFYETLDYNYNYRSTIFISDGILHQNYTSNVICLQYIAPEKIILKNIDNIKRFKKLNLNAQLCNNKFNNKSWFNKR